MKVTILAFVSVQLNSVRDILSAQQLNINYTLTAKPSRIGIH